MRPAHRIPTHPGEILREEFLIPLGMSRAALARHIGVSARVIGEIVRGRRAVTPDTAWRLAQTFGTTPDFWANLQVSYDLATSRPKTSIPELQHAG
jgi:addiction module HigA family antidote